jgi:hypothetical protein
MQEEVKEIVHGGLEHSSMRLWSSANRAMLTIEVKTFSAAPVDHEFGTTRNQQRFEAISASSAVCDHSRTHATRVARFGVWLVVPPEILILGSGFAEGS